MFADQAAGGRLHGGHIQLVGNLPGAMPFQCGAIGLQKDAIPVQLGPRQKSGMEVIGHRLDGQDGDVIRQQAVERPQPFGG